LRSVALRKIIIHLKRTIKMEKETSKKTETATDANTMLADSSILLWSEADLKRGDWIYTPDEVFGSGGKEHNIFQYDERINYSLHFGHEIRWYKLCMAKN